MIDYRLSRNLETNLRILSTELLKLSKEYDEKIAKHPVCKINSELANEHRAGNFKGKSEAYQYASRELKTLLDWYDVKE